MKIIEIKAVKKSWFMKFIEIDLRIPIRKKEVLATAFDCSLTPINRCLLIAINPTG